AVDLVVVVQGLAVVRDQMQVDGQRLAAAAQAARQVGAQGAVDAALQLVGRRQGGEQGVVGGGVGGGAAQAGAGGGQGGQAAGGVEQQGPEHAGGALGSVVGQAQVLLAEGLGVQADVRGGQGIMAGTHGSLPGDFGSTSHSREGPCAWHPQSSPLGPGLESTE